MDNFLSTNVVAILSILVSAYRHQQRVDTPVYYIVITIVERDTGKYHEFIAEYCYECEARVTILRQ